MGSRSGLVGLLCLAVTGFRDRALERRYLDYVTHTTAAPTLIWLAIMVLAHTAAFVKSLSTGDAQQALIGGFAYTVSLCLMLLLPRLYTALREPLMLACLLGRTTCRLVMVLLPETFSMSDSVLKYIMYGLDMLLDGFLEGTFEQIRVPYAVLGRMIELPIMAAFIYTRGVRQSYVAALARSAAVSGAGLAMTALTDVRMRAAFVRELHRRQQRGADAQGDAAAARGGTGACVSSGTAGAAGGAAKKSKEE
ncbi:hypothetical protein GPECTOR_44g10 [Gonium pectorale]|uniref:Uncharacterized protein n=1 Tax=Gonium pectorale TaxID=33097 RepID=A0A150G939_GONPE|nr:hypothetical protein GPECTOR_44g10 [Gonium pectorale]|eukprot:KXZ46331.1 hypothetical protein GPECTOR_44g10 [Gonium pectorale]